MKEQKPRRRYGVTHEWNGQVWEKRMMFAVVTGEMADGTKVWTECTGDRELVNIDKQYVLQTRDGWQEFVRL